ncbi:hypothetical protein [Sutcliffiella rhizosphaerae]|uniref:Uncharacterized protein n=1 Tax=Sutcliffiella rhizosphaerae TaxID=2880967 RepID=A0ABM8YUR9_9BACI|nr:hypothetical protein [Sutcliffiella rhizosphaerae]CAG9623728.1 hypothetical protein BACCIP111883_04560 [Sutcliffiella rhizosphaerae]
MEQLVDYSLRITPGLLLLTITYLILPKKTIAFPCFWIALNKIY